MQEKAIRGDGFEPSEGEVFLAPKDLMARWGVSAPTLAMMRKRGRGPRYVQVGGTGSAVRYPLSEVLAFEARSLRQSPAPRPAPDRERELPLEEG